MRRVLEDHLGINTEREGMAGEGVSSCQRSGIFIEEEVTSIHTEVHILWKILVRPYSYLS